MSTRIILGRQEVMKDKNEAFKWFDAVTGTANYVYGSGSVFNTISVTADGTTYNGTSRTTGTTISINSYGNVSGLSAGT